MQNPTTMLDSCHKSCYKVRERCEDCKKHKDSKDDKILQLEKEIRDGTWYTASVSKEVLFKGRDRLGTRRAKPLWTEVMELMGGKYKDIRDQFYGDSD